MGTEVDPLLAAGSNANWSAWVLVCAAIVAWSLGWMIGEGDINEKDRWLE